MREGGASVPQVLPLLLLLLALCPAAGAEHLRQMQSSAREAEQQEDGPDKLLMAIYHHIHHLERRHRMLPRHSVLLDVTRARVAKHYGMEPLAGCRWA